MQMFNQYLNQFPATDQQIIQELLLQYQSADPQIKALAQRRLEPYTKQLLQMSTADRMQRRQDAFQAGPAMPEKSMATMTPERPERLLNLQDQVFAQSSFMPSYNPLSSVQPSRPESMTVDPMDLFPQRPIRFRQGFPSALQSAKTSIQEGPTNPSTNTNSFDFGIPEVPQPSAPAQGLLDTEEPEDGGSFFDNPMSMGLIQAGLGLLSAPRYSTNPNDVTLSSALARGLGGFIQGYGTTQKRLSEAERQKLEDEYRKSERDFNKMYKEVMMDDAKSRIDERRGLTSDRVREKAEEKNLIDTMVNEILRAEGTMDNKTRKINLTTLARQDRDRFNDLHQNATTDRTPFEEILIESGRFTKEQAEAQPLSLLMQNAETISGLQANPEKPPKELKGDALERAEDILITAEPGSTDIRVSNAFDRIYSKELGENRTFNANTNREEVTKIYPVIPQEIEKKFPELVARRRQLEQGQSVKPPSLSQQQEENRAAALEAYHNEIVENNYDQPEPGYSFQGLKESISPRLASDEYLLKIRAQDRWIENVLRAASGAAIAKDEYADKRAQYFPEPGEGQAAVKAKRRARDIELQKAKLNLANQMEQARKQEALPKVEVEDPDAYLLE